MRQVRFGLRYKILLLLTLMPVATLAVYLSLAMQVFQADKLAYVFDSNSSVAGTVAAQTRAQFNSFLVAGRPLFQSYLKNRPHPGATVFPKEATQLFEDIRIFNSAVIYSRTPSGGFSQVAVLEKQPGTWARTSSAVTTEIAAMLGEAHTAKLSVAAPFRTSEVLFAEKWVGESETLFFVLSANAAELMQTFGTPMSHALYLVTRTGEVVFGPREELKTRITERYALESLTDTNSVISQGTEVVKDSTGEEMLVSYAKAGISDLQVISVVPKEKALSAVKVLLRKSILFFGLLISITIVIGFAASRKVTGAISLLLGATRKVSEGQFDIQVKVNANDEVGVLADNFNLMAAEVSRLIDQTAEKARMQSELQTAKTVQETLFPNAKNYIAGLEIVGFYEPASECGGDWWHCSTVNDKVFLWIGDATGHGAPAALITSAAKSASTIIESLNVGPAEALQLLNRSICEVARGRIMMTFFLASYDPATRLLRYANASHEPPYLIKKKDTPLKKKDLITLNEVTGPRLGQSPDSVYQEGEVRLDPDDSIIFYTDGVTDIRNPKDEAWGERDFLKAIIASQKEFPSAEKTVAHLVDSFQQFRKDGNLVDDVTFFVTKCS